MSWNNDDYSGSQFQGGGGGGFNPQSPGLNNNMTSPATGKQRRNIDACLLTCTIKQILMSPEPRPDENLCIDGKELTNVCIIGQIIQIDVQSTHTTYRLDDGSGIIEVKIWSGGENDQSSKQTKYEDLQLSSYIRVIGRVQSFKSKRSLTGFTLTPIQDCDEITLHFLECIYAHLTNTGSTQKLNFGDNNNNNNNNNDNDIMMNDVSNKQTMKTNSNRNMMNDNMPNNDNIPEGQWSEVEKKIFRFINRSDIKNTDEGASIEQIMQAITDEDVTDIREAVERLSTEGQLYTTIDDEHFKSTQ
jgi:replication factor A2